MAVSRDVDVVSIAAVVVEAAVVGGVPMQQRHGSTGYSGGGGGGGVSLRSTPSGSSIAGSGGGGKEAWFQAVTASVDVSDTDSARARTTPWCRLNSFCTQLPHFRP